MNTNQAVNVEDFGKLMGMGITETIDFLRKAGVPISLENDTFVSSQLLEKIPPTISRTC